MSMLSMLMLLDHIYDAIVYDFGAFIHVAGR